MDHLFASLLPSIINIQGHSILSPPGYSAPPTVCTTSIAYAFRERLFTYELTGQEIWTFKQVWIPDEQRNFVLNLEVPINILAPVLIQRFVEAADAASAAYLSLTW